MESAVFIDDIKTGKVSFKTGFSLIELFNHLSNEFTTKHSTVLWLAKFDNQTISPMKIRVVSWKPVYSEDDKTLVDVHLKVLILNNISYSQNEEINIQCFDKVKPVSNTSDKFNKPAYQVFYALERLFTNEHDCQTYSDEMIDIFKECVESGNIAKERLQAQQFNPFMFFMRRNNGNAPPENPGFFL